MASATAGPSSTGLAPSNTIQRLSTNKPATPVIPSSSTLSPGKPKAAVSGFGTTSGVPVKDVISPGELCGFVDTLLSQLETRFDEMSEQVLGRMNEMSSRIDNLETTIQDLMSGSIEEGALPAPASGGGKR